MIKKVKNGYRVLSEKGRNMGTYKKLRDAVRRLYEIEYFAKKKQASKSSN